MKLIHSAKELRTQLDELQKAGKTVAFVPTMGALHEGHLSLTKLAKANADVVVVSVFVNPLQFGPKEDFDKYPRTLNQDAQLLEAEGVEYLYAPDVEDIYPNGQVITQRAGVIGSTFEGASRVGHFDGMLTVVNRLFEIVEPDFVVFGEKDAQQVFLVKKLTQAKFPNIRFIEGPTLRESSGLAMSSRNRYLSEADRTEAEQLYKNLLVLKTKIESNQAVASAIDEVAKNIEASGHTKLEYLAVIDPQIFRPVGDDYRGSAKIIVAVKVGEVRLIDTMNVNLESENA